MHGIATLCRSPRSISRWTRRSALCGLAFLAPLALHAQQGAQAKGDTSAFCIALSNYLTEHPEVVQQFASNYLTSHPEVVQQFALADTAATSHSGDTVSAATRQAIVAATARRDFDSASALLRHGFPKASEPQDSEAIAKLFRSMATITDSAKLAQVTRAMFITSGRDLDMQSIQFLGVIPDTLRNLLFAGAAISPNKLDDCSLESTAPYPQPLPQTKPPQPKP